MSLFSLFIFIWFLIFTYRFLCRKFQRKKKKRLLLFLYFLIYFLILFYLKELRHIIIASGLSWLGFTLFSKSPLIWSVGSDEPSSSTIGVLLDWSSPPRELDFDEVFSLGGNRSSHDAQASSSHLAHEQTDARLPAAGEPAPPDPLQEPGQNARVPVNEGPIPPANQQVPHPFDWDRLTDLENEVGDLICQLRRLEHMRSPAPYRLTHIVETLEEEHGLDQLPAILADLRENGLESPFYKRSKLIYDELTRNRATEAVLQREWMGRGGQ